MVHAVSFIPFHLRSCPNGVSRTDFSSASLLPEIGVHVGIDIKEQAGPPNVLRQSVANSNRSAWKATPHP